MDSFTTGIGTPFYVAPELQVPGARYNQRVDMYSLGIIFVELWCPLQTRMERFKVLCQVRQIDCVLPVLFDKPEMANQKALSKQLLTHDPKKRITASELLRSDLLPARMEDEAINDAIRTLSNPNTPYYGKLMNALFQQSVDRYKDFCYDVNTVP
jgi:eukaryotic translation initiation factor 2-alpha kinase 4